MAEGDGTKALREMAEGKGAIISESFQRRFGKGTHDTIELATPSGPVGFKVLGIYVDYSSDIGSVLMDRALYKKYWRDDLVDAFDLWLEPGADMHAVIEKIKAAYGEKYQLFVSTHRELRDAVVKIMEQSFVVNYAVGQHLSYTPIEHPNHRTGLQTERTRPDLKYKLVWCGPRRTRFRSITPLSAICCKLCLMLAGDHMFSCFQSNSPETAFSSPIGTSSSR
jgi:hypothetical protein